MVDLSNYETFKVPEKDILASIKSDAQPHNCILVSYAANSPRKLRFGLVNDPNLRMVHAVEHVDKIMNSVSIDEKNLDFSFVFQCDDKSADVFSASWEIKPSYQHVCLVPDLYYTLNSGYQNFFPDGVPDWDCRESRVFWRGTTTGLLYITRQSLADLPRFKLCSEARKLGLVADVRFYSVVQTANREEQSAIVELLAQDDMIADWIEVGNFVKYKYIVQIGGNATSWGLMQKLRLGCCILFVEGQWKNWHERQLVPWVHFVPVRSDLSDFPEKVQWCLDNDAQAMRIGFEGRKYSLSVDYSDELKAAAQNLCQHFSQGRESSA